ncbi:YdaU family protein [Lacisediminimonas profundi]|uniref:YdaU family protein n=1 Tax=Lacisediminimonas profundi TaxID=2603856 RepID=UPI00124AEB7F|nr:YdaU family protein [Lacisediminimonas profundi]
MNFYKHYIGDYGRSTGDLSLSEHGAYRLMLDHFYGIGKPLPAEKKSLYRLLRGESAGDRAAIDAVCIRFWRSLPPDLDTIYEWLKLDSQEAQSRYKKVAAEWDGSGLINIRALLEILSAAAIAEKNREIAIDREEKRRLKRAGETCKQYDTGARPS